MMLDLLLGSKSAERILLFLWVNEWAYTSQMQRAYGSALTPFQSMLHKFEQAGIVTCTLSKNKKLYRLNPEYPLYAELRALLQKAFTSLPAEEKKHLFVLQNIWSTHSYRHQKRIALCLQTFWEKLSQVQKITIRAQTGGEAIGEVKVNKEKPNTLIFHERGRWMEGERIEFSNALRWSLLFDEGMITLEHLRQGMNHPILLFHLAPVGARQLQSIDSHLCQSDCYFGRLELHPHSIHLIVKVLGRNKNQLNSYTYEL